MYGTITVFTLLRFARAASEISDQFMFIVGGKAVYATFMIGFAVFTRYWGVNLLGRLESMTERTTTSKETKGSKKKMAAVKRFKNFLIWECITASIWMLELWASVGLKHSNFVSLGKDPMVVFCMKVVQRGTGKSK